ncbi:unnamed protein product, partial [Meganyctiphanes norvegica]
MADIRDAKAAKMLEALQSDLKTLCMETKKRYPQIKDSCEEAIIKVRGAAMNSSQSSLSQITSQILYPLVQAAETKDPKIAKLSLGVMQRLIVAEVVDESSGEHIVETLWMLMENGIEELKVLQTATLLITTSDTVKNNNIAKALVLCFRLHFTKDPIVVNTAGATVRQLVSAVFERVIHEDADYAVEEGSDMSKPKGKSLNTKNLQGFPGKVLCTSRPVLTYISVLFLNLVIFHLSSLSPWFMGVVSVMRINGSYLLEYDLMYFYVVFCSLIPLDLILYAEVCNINLTLFSPAVRDIARVVPPLVQSHPNHNLQKAPFVSNMADLNPSSTYLTRYFLKVSCTCEL